MARFRLWQSLTPVEGQDIGPSDCEVAMSRILAIGAEVKEPMRRRMSVGIACALFFALVAVAIAQSDDPGPTMRPVIRGRHAAIASMKAEATEAARRIL